MSLLLVALLSASTFDLKFDLVVHNRMDISRGRYMSSCTLVEMFRRVNCLPDNYALVLFLGIPDSVL